nr:uncharacterized mitochondrial protein AtMg00810-like [Tanacetum cinerariifolium]
NGTPVDAKKYRSIIGAIMYLTSSRPGIVHAACLCAWYQAKPTEKHLKEVKRIFCYLRRTINMGLWYTKDSGFELTGFSDADYAGCKDTFKSTSMERFNYLVCRLGMRSLSPQELERLAKSQVVHCVSGLSFLTAVCLIRQSDLGNKPLPISFRGSGLVFLLHSGLPLSGSSEKERYNAGIRATNILHQGLPKDIYTLINHYTDAKDIWDNVKMLLKGSKLTKEDRESQLYTDFEHFRQNKVETIHDYYVRFTKLIDDMRNINMTMPRMYLNSKFINNMFPEWIRFVRIVKLNRGLKECNYDQLYVYLKQYEAHANESKMMLEQFTQHMVDPLALMYHVSPQQVVVQNVQGRQNRGQGNNLRGTGAAGNKGAQNRVRNVNLGQARQIKCYNYNGIGHIARNYTQPKRPQNSKYFKDKMSLMQAQKNGVVLDEEHLLFIAGGQDNIVDEDAPTAQTMFLANLSLVDPVYDEAGRSYNLDILSECMRTRNSYFPNNSSVIIPRRQNKRRTPNVVEPELRTIVEVAPMADNRTMEDLLQAPTKGSGEVIVIPKINADHFEIKTNLLQLVQANPYHGFERENPHTHIYNFKMITSTLKFRDVPNDVIKLMMFPYSLEGSARVWMNTTSKENTSKTGDCIDKLTDQISTLVDIFAKKAVTPAPVKAVEESCVTCGGAHAYYNCPNTDSNQPSVCVATGTYNQVAPQNCASNYMAPPSFAPVQNSQNRFNQNQGQGNNFSRGNNFHGNQSFQVSNQGFQNQPFQVPNNPVQQDALLLMPKFSSMIKSLLTNKDKLFELAKIPLNENCLAMLLKKLPKKLGDPGKFLIPCDFPGIDV